MTLVKSSPTRAKAGRVSFHQVILHALSVVHDSVLIVDENWQVRFANVASQNLLEFSLHSQSIALADILQIVHCQTREPQALTRDLFFQPSLQRRFSETGLLVCAEQRTVPFELSVSAFQAGSDETFFIINIKDLSQTKQLTEAISFHQSHDPLTGLINRAEFERALQNALFAAKEGATNAAVLHLDVDQFKVVNDICGHVAGDELLLQIIELVQSELGRHDILARIGGDEFGILLGDTSSCQAFEKAESIRKSVESLLFTWGQKSFSLSVSVGVAPINQHSENWANLLSQADAACYHAKSLGRNRVRLYSEDDRELAKSHLEMEWVSGIVKALRSNRLQLFAQRVVPIKDKKKSEKYHQEILLRLVSESGEIIPPPIFLPAAERFNLIIMIDRWVVSQTLAWLKTNLKHDAGLGMCTINLSGCSISQPAFLEFVLSELDAQGVPGEKLCFELTETAAIQHLKQAKFFMQTLAQKNCKFALDDFGTGMSSFSYLKALPVDYLKIDGTFVKDIENDKIDLAMVTSINQIGHAMNMKTIAEFVENDRIKSILAEIDVDFAQGYAIHRPEPLC